MIDIQNHDIMISQGDTFAVVFALNGFKIVPTDVVTFSVKRTEFSDKCLMKKTFQDYDGGETIELKISAAEMAVLEPGEYVYDLMIVSGDTKTTLNFPAKLIIRRVAHD